VYAVRTVDDRHVAGWWVTRASRSSLLLTVIPYLLRLLQQPSHWAELRQLQKSRSRLKSSSSKDVRWKNSGAGPDDASVRRRNVGAWSLKLELLQTRLSKSFPRHGTWTRPIWHHSTSRPILRSKRATCGLSVLFSSCVMLSVHCRFHGLCSGESV
jgi:hypothetical protein